MRNFFEDVKIEVMKTLLTGFIYSCVHSFIHLTNIFDCYVPSMYVQSREQNKQLTFGLQPNGGRSKYQWHY